MEQLDFFPVPSPCIGVCQVNNRGYCKGCLRNRDERFNWLTLTNEQKRNVVRLCLQRKKRVEQAKRKAQQGEDVKQQTIFTQSDLFGD